ncbi:MAG: thiol protease/hemagglutinin PrtT [Bacteroides sp.]
MKIRIFSLSVVFLLMSSWFAFSAPIDVRRAQQIASEQLEGLQSSLRGSNSELRLVYTSAGVPTRGNAVAQQDFYVFARGESGYVVVAGDDNVPEVLGYSHESPFVTENMPIQLRTWLEQCAQWVSKARKSGKQYTASYLETQTTPIAPLLGGMVWEQTGAFNAQTPKVGEENAPVGCVATALAQIMRYHCWPRKGRGAIKYSKGSATYYRKFDAEYDWENMPNDVSRSSSPLARKAVATLSADVGYASKMNYGKEASGTSSEDAMVAMRKFMRYANTLRLRNKDFYDYEEWTKICLDELKAKRPIYYSGAAVGVGHAFVCDGYDGAGRFHFNWGWGGLSNGYFVLTNLEPSAQSTGGGGEGGYVLGCQIITGLQPLDATEPAFELVCEKVTLPTKEQEKTTPIAVAMTGLWNYSYGAIVASPALQILDSEGKVVLESHANQTESIQFRYGYRDLQLNANVSSLGNGTYTVRPAFYVPSKNLYYPAQVGVLNAPAAFRVDGGKVVFVETSTAANLALVSSSTTMNSKMKNLFEFTIQNNGSLPYRSMVAGIYSEAADKLTTRPTKNSDLLFNRSISLQPGEKQTFNLLLDGPTNATERFLHILYDVNGGSEDQFPVLADKTTYPGDSKFITATLTVEPAYSFAKFTGTKAPYTPPYELSFVRKFTTYESGTVMTITLKLKAPADKGVNARLIGGVFGTASEGSRTLVSPIMSFGTIILRPSEEREVSIQQIVYLPPSADYAFHLFDFYRGKHQLEQMFEFSATGEVADALPIPDNSAYPDGPDNFDDSNKGLAVSDAASYLLEGVSLAPNPTRGDLNIYLPNDVEGQALTIEVFDVTGRKLLSSAAQGDRQLYFSVAHLSKGLYLLKVQCGMKQTALRFVVE